MLLVTRHVGCAGTVGAIGTGGPLLSVFRNNGNAIAAAYAYTVGAILKYTVRNEYAPRLRSNVVQVRAFKARSANVVQSHFPLSLKPIERLSAKVCPATTPSSWSVVQLDKVIAEGDGMPEDGIH